MEVAPHAAEVTPRERPPLLAVPGFVGLMDDTFGALLDVVVGLDRMLAHVASLRAEAVDQARQWSETHQQVTTSSDPHQWSARTVARKVLVSELACALRLPERSAETLVAESQALMHELPETLVALNTGELSYRHAQVVVDQVASLGGVSEQARTTLETELVPLARELSVAKFERVARALRERAHPETIVERHRRALSDREVRLAPARDGMSWLELLLPCATASACYDRVTASAKSLQGSGEPRTLSQLRADVAAGLLTDGVTSQGVGVGIRANVTITVPVMTLLGHSQEPAVLAGYGPIDPVTARRLTAEAPSLRRILTHPETGAVLSVGRERYVVPAELRRWLRLRDETCRFPGCGVSARHSDLDHTVDWAADGPSSHDNLAHLCPKHHKLKHDTAWSVSHLGQGDLAWRSPSGRGYVTRAAMRMQPATGPPAHGAAP